MVLRLSKIYTFIACFCLATTYYPAYGQSAGSQEYEWVRIKVDSTLKAHDIPALSIGIISEGKLTFIAGFGTYDRESLQKVDEESMYQIASDTKKLTAIIVKNLAVEGKLDLDTSIVDYLGDDLSSSAKEELRPVTLRHLLQHTSGVPYRAPGNRRIDGDPMLIEYSEEDLLRDLNTLTLQHEPGAQFSYSNFGYAIVGHICERVSGQSFASLLNTYIAEEYGLSNTTVQPNQAQRSLIPTPYRKDDRSVKTKPWKMGKMAPGGGVYSNILDLSKLMLRQLQAYQQLEAGEIENSLLILTEDVDSSHYGFGLAKTVRDGQIWYGHGGDLDGYASAYIFSPEANAGLIILTSSGGRWVGQLENEIREEIFKMDND